MQNYADGCIACDEHLDVSAADLAALGWVKPEKLNTLKAALSKPKQLQAICFSSAAAVQPPPFQQDQVCTGHFLLQYLMRCHSSLLCFPISTIKGVQHAWCFGVQVALFQSDTLALGQAAERPSPDARPALRLGLAPACALEFGPKEGSSSAVAQSAKTQGHMPVAGMAAEGANADARLTVQSDVAAACRGGSEQHRSTAAVQSPAVARQSPHHQQLPPMHAQQDRDLIPGAPQTGREGHQMEPGSFQAPNALEKSARDAAASHFSKPSKQVAAEQMLPVNWQGEFPAMATSAAFPRAAQPSDAPPESLEPAQSLQHQNFRITRIAGARSISAVPDTAALDLSNVGSGISPGSSSSGQGASQHHLMESLLLGGLSDSAACSIPWRTKRKAVCLEPAQSCIPHAQVDVPQKRGAVTQHVPVSSCQASESASERAPETCHLQRPCPLQSQGANGGLPMQIGEPIAKASQALPMPEPTSNATDLAKEPPQQAADVNKGQVSTDPSQPVFSALPSASANDSFNSPAWMAEQVSALAEMCTAAPLPNDWETGGLIGRSVGFMLLEHFDAGGQTISCGIKTGRFDPCCYSQLSCPAPEILERWTLPDAANDSHCHSEVDVMGAGCLNMSLMAILRTSAAAPHARCSTAFILCD